jgi:hypothetical protein
MMVFAFAGDSTITSRDPSAIGGIANLPPDAPRVRVPVRGAVVRRAVGAFVALAVVVAVRFTGFFVGAFVVADVRVRVVFAGVFFIVSSGIPPLLCTFTSHPRQGSRNNAAAVKPTYQLW